MCNSDMSGNSSYKNEVDGMYAALPLSSLPSDVGDLQGYIVNFKKYLSPKKLEGLSTKIKEDFEFLIKVVPKQVSYK